MKRLQGCLYWMALIMLVFAAMLGILFMVKPAEVYALRDYFAVVRTFARVEREIMAPTPFGRYYSGLYFKNFNELKQILSTHPTYREDMNQLMYLYIPHIEAVLEGRGDEVQITQEEVDTLETFFNQIRSASDGELGRDIERELTRTPLQDFIGMSMDETLAYIESTWERDFSPPPYQTDTDRFVETGTPVP